MEDTANVVHLIVNLKSACLFILTYHIFILFLICYLNEFLRKIGDTININAYFYACKNDTC